MRATPSLGPRTCALTKEQEEGPFYLDEGLLRADITEGESGVLLTLILTVVDASGCTPRAGAAVDVWHANRGGKYSDEAREGTTGKTFLRGVQLTNANGQVTFKTICPGWYAPRACHIHVKVHTGGSVSGSRYASAGGTVVHGGQMFFPPSHNIALRGAYADNLSAFVNNDTDMVYTRQDGDTSLIALSGSMTDGFVGNVTVGIP